MSSLRRSFFATAATTRRLLLCSSSCTNSYTNDNNNNHKNISMLHQQKRFVRNKAFRVPGTEAELVGNGKTRIKCTREPHGSSIDDSVCYTLSHRIGTNYSQAVAADAELLIEPALIKTVMLTDNQVYLPLGTRIIGLYVAEYFQEKYPNLPAPVYNDLVKFMLLPRSLGQLGIELGVGNARKSVDPENNTTTTTAFCSIVGLVYESKGYVACQEFLDSVLSPTLRQLQIEKFLAVPNAAFLYNQIFKTAEYRILNEAGRLGDQSMFHVGVFTEDVFRGEGVSRNLRKAKGLAAENALIGVYTSTKAVPKIAQSDFVE